MTGASGDANIGVTPVRAGFGFGEVSLSHWLQANVPGFSEPLLPSSSRAATDEASTAGGMIREARFDRTSDLM